jgi:glycosyltransferase involved in cell wall biosynthesis
MFMRKHWTTPTRSGPARITHVIGGLGAGGAEGMLARLLPTMDARRFSASVISLTDAGVFGDALRARGVEVTCLDMARSPRGALASARLLRVLGEQRPHLVQTWMYHSDLLGGLAAAALGIPAVWGIRHSALHGGRPTTRAIRRTCAALSHVVPRAIVSCSTTAAASHVASGYSGRRMRVIENGFDLDAFRPDSAARDSVRAELGLPAGARLVGLVARFHPCKGIPLFVDMASVVARHESSAHFVVCGAGASLDNPEFRRLAEGAPGVMTRLSALGERRDVARITAALDVACSTSMTEGFSNTLCEAMASAVPCVSTPAGAARDVLQDVGVVVDDFTPASFASAVLRLLRLPPREAVALGLQGRERVAARYSLAATARAYEALYGAILEPAEC